MSAFVKVFSNDFELTQKDFFVYRYYFVSNFCGADYFRLRGLLGRSDLAVRLFDNSTFDDAITIQHGVLNKVGFSGKFVVDTALVKHAGSGNFVIDLTGHSYGIVLTEQCLDVSYQDKTISEMIKDIASRIGFEADTEETTGKFSLSSGGSNLSSFIFNELLPRAISRYAGGGQYVNFFCKFRDKKIIFKRLENLRDYNIETSDLVSEPVFKFYRDTPSKRWTLVSWDINKDEPIVDDIYFDRFFFDFGRTGVKFENGVKVIAPTGTRENVLDYTIGSFAKSFSMNFIAIPFVGNEKNTDMEAPCVINFNYKIFSTPHFTSGKYLVLQSAHVITSERGSVEYKIIARCGRRYHV